MNDIVQVLIEFPNDFKPIFLEHSVDDKTYATVDEWCEGYLAQHYPPNSG